MSKGMRFTEEWYETHLAKQKTAGAGAREQALPRRTQVPAPAAQSAPKAPKYRNEKRVVDGIVFDSIKEARYYEQLKLQKAAGEILDFVRQVSVPLSIRSRRRMRLDFVVFMPDGSVRWIDVKGFVTKDWTIKRDELEANTPIRVEVA